MRLTCSAFGSMRWAQVAGESVATKQNGGAIGDSAPRFETQTNIIISVVSSINNILVVSIYERHSLQHRHLLIHLDHTAAILIIIASGFTTRLMISFINRIIAAVRASSS